MAIVKRTLKRPNPETGRKVAYLVRVEGRRDAFGRRKQLAKTVATMEEARSLERSWLLEIERGTALDPSRVTVSEVLDLWLDAKRGTISSNSLRDYETAARLHIKPSIGTVGLQKLSADQVQRAYRGWQDAGMSSRMVHRCHIVLSQALDHAVRFSLMHRNVAKDVARPRIDRGKPSVWTPAEVGKFLDAARDDSLTPLWHLLVLEGMRRGEALGLRWQDINWERGTVHIQQTVAPDKANRGKAIIQARAKTATSSRTVRLTDESIEALKEHRDRQRFMRQVAGNNWNDFDLIVCTSHGTPINPGNVIRSFDRIVSAAGVRRIRVHDLRHTAATLLLRAGVPAKIVSERLGHAGVAITMDLYSHVLPDMQDVAAKAMSSLLNREQGVAI